MDNVAIRIQAVINTLNTVSVRGAEDMNRMLGCIQTLNGLRADWEKGAETNEAHSED